MDKLMIDKLSDFFRTQPVDKAWIFGSYSRNEEKEGSDIDVLVRFLKGIRITLFSYASMQYKMERLLNKKIDLVEEGQLKDFAEDSVNADKILIYERKK
ncbi:nucleotidyltransferase family protein [Tannerella sp.]|uniref:nucleotidyltransferase family protein n=1 Tax=Tannerella sp. TaxID=2382127 RepID=UPI003FA2176B